MVQRTIQQIMLIKFL